MSRVKYKSPKISVIIPTYNEENVIVSCVDSLQAQRKRDIEIIVVDDGSTDQTVKRVKTIKSIKLLRQQHKGPGAARNKGAKSATGRILVFVDADMTFDKNFIKNLTLPIVKETTIGTDSQEEYLANAENYWALCWNIGRFAAAGVRNGNPFKDMTPNKSDYGGIYRAILKKEFEKIGGFEKGGDYTDDESLERKLGIKAKLAKGAIFYHKNPSSFFEVWQRASWIGSGKSFTGTWSKRTVNIIKFSFPVALIKAIITALVYRRLEFIPFKLVYDTAVWVTILKSLL